MNKKIKRIVGLMFAVFLIIGQFVAGVTDAQTATNSTRIKDYIDQKVLEGK